MIRETVGLHVAFNTLSIARKMQYYIIAWDMASDMQYLY